MKRLFLSALICLTFAPVILAQQNAADTPASKEDIQRYLDAVHSRELMQNTMNSMMKPMHKMIHEELEKEKNLPPDAEARIDKVIDSMFQDFPYDEFLK